jgi:hypothetical protein
MDVIGVVFPRHSRVTSVRVAVVACDRRQLVRHFLPRIRTAFLGDHDAEAPADPERGPARRVSSLGPEVPVPIGTGTRHGRLAAVCLVPLRLTPLGIRLVALLWALILGQASVAGNLSVREEVPPPDNSVPAAATGWVPSGSADSLAGSENKGSLRPHKRFHAFPRIPRGNDPNDDETSDDPNDDDDAWDDLNAHDDTDVPMLAWLQETVPFLIAPECAPAIRPVPPSPPFLTPQRLRC